MRIIAGSARGRRLNTLAGTATRPTTDRAREALFSMLISRLGSLNGTQVLDLFAGTGALGLEAISRGADSAVFVEKAPSAAAVIEANINHCGFDANCRVVSMDVASYCHQPTINTRYDLIFIDPPYHGDLIQPTLQAIKEHHLLARDGMIVVESEPSFACALMESFFEVEVDRIYAKSRIRLLARLDSEEQTA